MNTPARFSDDGEPVYAWATGEVLVVCPGCGSRAAVRQVGEELFGTRRFSCGSCGSAREAGSTSSWGESPVDPWFGYPLWLSAAFRDHVVWAFNRRHAEQLRAFVAADLRRRTTSAQQGGGDRWELMSMVEKLPAWYKAAGNREALTNLLDELIEKAG